MCLRIHMCVFGENVWKRRNTNYFLHLLSSILENRKRDICNGRMLSKTVFCGYVES